MMSWLMKSVPSSLRAFAAIAMLSLTVVGFVGCTKTENSATSTRSKSDVDLSHGGWWCVEHGVPESECPRCDSSLLAKYKDSGDWCKEHDRPESQCFICGPKRFEKFAAVYEAKTGRQPPKPTE